MTPPRPKEFWIYYAIFTLIAILLFLIRRKPRGMRLRLRGDALPSDRLEHGASTILPEPEIKSVERSLNVHFNYNGETWDAYEVLGLPAGASKQSVISARAEQLAQVDPTSREFIEAAYRAIAAGWISN